MRPYSLFVILLLSLLLPLQSVADALLPMSACSSSEMMEMHMADNADSSNTHSPEHQPEHQQNCCDQMQNCHGCNAHVHFYVFSAPSFHFTVDVSFHVMNEPNVAAFDPASVWRPPTNNT
jgi:hypothetical protein